MARVYYIAAEFELKEKPEWLDGFRAKYDDPLRYHVTLRGPAYFDEAQLPQIQRALGEIARKPPPFEALFDAYRFNRTNNGHCIMVDAGPDPELHGLQRIIHAAFADTGVYVKPASAEYDAEFRPHITIGRHLDDARFAAAKVELTSPVVCRADVANIVLDITNYDSAADLYRPADKFSYTLVGKR